MEKLYNGRGLSAGERLFVLYKYFLGHKNKNGVITYQEIQDFLSKQWEIEVSVNTLYSDIEKLKNPETFNLDIEYDFSKRGYRLKNPPFEPYEVRLMLDSIQASRFITQKKAKEISAKIKTLTDTATAAKLNHQAYADDRIHSQNETVIPQADRLYQAIEAHRQIKFRYFHYSHDKTAEKKYSKSGNMLTVSPYRLIWHNGNLYLFAYDGKKFRYYRVDRMEVITKPLPLEAEGAEEYKEQEKSLKKVRVFDMYSGPEYLVKIRFTNNLAHTVMDRFGKDVMMIPDGANRFTIQERVQVSPPFYAWIATFGRSAKIINPPEVVKGMRDFLNKSMDMYNDDGETL